MSADRPTCGPSPDRRRPADAGFTLLEVLVSLIVLATIGAVLVAVVSVVLRNTPSAEARAEDARSVLGLVTWLPQDVDSTPPEGFDTDPSAGTGCGFEPDGVDRVNVVTMEWTESYAGATTRFVAAYHHVSDGANARLVRVTCRTGATSSSPVEQNLTSELPLLPGDWSPGSPPVSVMIGRDAESGDVVTFRLALTLIDGDEVVLDAAPKNPADTLPPTTLPGWYPPSPETSMAVNSPPTVDDQSLEVHPGTPRSTTISASDPNGNPIELSVVSAPAGWTVELTGATLTVTAPTPPSYPGSGVVEVLADDQNGGTATGRVDVTVVDPATPLLTTTTTTTTTTTLPMCEVLSADVSPSPVKNVQQDSSNQGGGSVNIGVLAKLVTVTAETNEHCTGLEIRYDSGGVNSPPQVGFVQNGPNSWSASLPGKDQGSSETWSDGDHALAFFDADGGPWGSVVLKVN